MLKNLKRFAAAALFAACAIGTSANAYAQKINMNLVYDGVSHTYNEEEIKINVGGKEITGLDVPAVSINSRTMVPARAVFEELGAEVAWNDSTKEVYIIKDTDVVTLKIDSSTGTINSAPFVMDTPAKIVNDRTLIPIRAAAEALKYTVGWDDATRTVSVSKSGTNSSDNSGNGNQNNQNNQNNNAVVQTPAVNVNSITVPASLSADSVFKIGASGEISKYESYMLDSTRLVVDIYNADMAVSNSKITTTNCPVVSSVRTAQFQTEPEKITRVVFDLSGTADYKVSETADKKSISVTFATNRISNINVSKSGTSQIIKIYGDSAPTVQTTLKADPLSLIIDIPGAVSNLKEDLGISNDLISSMTSQQLDSKTVRITALLEKNAEVSTSKEHGCTVVTVTRSAVENVSFNETRHILRLDGTNDINSSDITLTDSYANKTYTICLPGDYSDIFGTGSLLINDDYISKVQVTLENKKTYIKLTEKSKISVKMRDYGTYIQFTVSDPDGSSSSSNNNYTITGQKIVVIDAGHGKQDNGASGNGLLEKNVNLAIVQRLYNLLDADPNIKVYATRLDDSYPTNISRAQMANNLGADLFVSIHQNSNTSSAPSGTEVLYMVHGNETSGNGLTSKKAAQTLLNNVVNALGTTNRGIKVRKDLIVLNQTDVPAVLVETCFISNPSDAAIIAQDRYKDAMAQALYSGIRELLSQY